MFNVPCELKSKLVDGYQGCIGYHFWTTWIECTPFVSSHRTINSPSSFVISVMGRAFLKADESHVGRYIDEDKGDGESIVRSQNNDGPTAANLC
jgi:hypothetical protein